MYIYFALNNFFVIEAVRKTHEHVTDNEIGESISKWLAQATLRIQRAKYIYDFNLIYIYF